MLRHLVGIILTLPLILGAPVTEAEFVEQGTQGECPVGIAIQGVSFYIGEQGRTAWTSAVEAGLQTATFPTTHSNVLLASEVMELSQSSKAQVVDLSLTFLGLKTGLPISFALRSDPGTARHPQGPAVSNEFLNASLAIGGTDMSEDDDFHMSFSKAAGETPFDVYAFGMDLVGNEESMGEALKVYAAHGACIAALHSIPTSGHDGSIFLGLVASQPLSRIFFDEDDAADDVAVKDFRFGFKEHHVQVGWRAWAVFALFVAAALAIDLTCASTEQLQSSLMVALAWSVAWVALALLFDLCVWWTFGMEWAVLFLAGYMLEELLSIDNLFVFLLIFKSFDIPLHLQHKGLLYGILLSILLRAAFIVCGTLLLERFKIVLAFFGIFLIYSGVKAELSVGDDDDDAVGFQVFSRWAMGVLGVPLSEENEPSGALWVHTITVKGTELQATPLLAVLLAIAVADLVFALDSIPAILTITTDRFIVITSNAFAVLGLRAVFWVLASLDSQFDFIQHVLAYMLTAAGAKLILSWAGYHLQDRSNQVVFGVAVAMFLLVVRGLHNRKKVKDEDT